MIRFGLHKAVERITRSDRLLIASNNNQHAAGVLIWEALHRLICSRMESFQNKPLTAEYKKIDDSACMHLKMCININ